jgi:uncharacterized protein YceK
MGRASLAVLGLAVLCLSGCGTAANLSGGFQGWRKAQIYGGVRTDVKSAEQFVADNWTSESDFQQDVGTVVGVGLISLDVPLSLIGDTLTLPITIPAAILSGPAPQPGLPAATNNLAQKPSSNQ